MIELNGKILFDPVDKTRKQKAQSSWKRVAMILLPSDICEYYCWFIKKRYGIKLNLPLRNAHITFINDSLNDMNISEKEWELLKKKYNGKKINVKIDLNPYTDSHEENPSYHWWFKLSKETNLKLMNIRYEANLCRPYYGFHMTIGYANNKNQEQSKYIGKILWKTNQALER